jgi:FMN phosphatase YigB (HAD superfamily)
VSVSGSGKGDQSDHPFRYSSIVKRMNSHNSELLKHSMAAQRKLIIFDLDGTLYKLRGGSYKKSPLRREVLNNARNFLTLKLSINKTEAKRILASIQKKYGEQISIGLEKEFDIDRRDYFNTVWNIPARSIIIKERNLKKILLTLNKEYKLIVVSDAPLVWISNVLKELNIEGIFRNKIFSGEGNRRKGLNNSFSYIARKLKIKSQNCITVGDQESTDIIPAKKLGMKAIFIHSKQQSSFADLNIKSLQELLKEIKRF